MAKPIVLDSTAVLAVLFDEPGAPRIVDQLPESLLSSVNLAEIQSHLNAHSYTAAAAWDRLLSMGFEVVPFSEDQARLAADLAANSRSRPLGLAERACLALAIERNATVYTTNRAWKNLPKLASTLEVVLIA